MATTAESLGWFTVNPVGKIGKAFDSSAERIIASDAGGARYFLRNFPELSDSEKKLLSKVIKEFRESEAKPSQVNVRNCLKIHCIENLVEIGKGQKQRLLNVLEHSLAGFGPMDDILADGSIEEIALIGTLEKPVYVFHRKLGWLETNLFFESEQAVCDLVNRMSQAIGRRLSFNTPSINAVLPDGSRLHAAIGPVAFSGPCFTIRKFSKELFTPAQLVRNKTVSAEAAAFIWMALEAGCSMIIAGNTGSGKTTTLNALFSFVPASERIVVVEETPEISLPHAHVVKLNVVKEQGIGMQDLIIDTLRMRPDRIVVGEVRSSEEMNAFIDTLLAGQGKGSYCTFHSQSCSEVVKRGLLLGISPIDLATIDLVVVQRRWDVIEKGVKKEVRHVTEIAELVPKENGIGANLIFGFDFGKGKLVRVGESSNIVEKMKRCFSKGAKELVMEEKRRADFLEKKSVLEISLEGFFAGINSATAVGKRQI